MAHRYLEVTYRNGRALAAYLYLPRQEGDKSVRVAKYGEYLVDWTEDGRPMGIEIPSPSQATLEGLNAVIAELHLAPLNADEISPLLAAA